MACRRLVSNLGRFVSEMRKPPCVATESCFRMAPSPAARRRWTEFCATLSIGASPACPMPYAWPLPCPRASSDSPTKRGALPLATTRTWWRWTPTWKWSRPGCAAGSSIPGRRSERFLPCVCAYRSCNSPLGAASYFVADQSAVRAYPHQWQWERYAGADVAHQTNSQRRRSLARRVADPPRRLGGRNRGDARHRGDPGPAHGVYGTRLAVPGLCGPRRRATVVWPVLQPRPVQDAGRAAATPSCASHDSRIRAERDGVSRRDDGSAQPAAFL